MKKEETEVKREELEGETAAVCRLQTAVFSPRVRNSSPTSTATGALSYLRQRYHSFSLPYMRWQAGETLRFASLSGRGGLFSFGRRQTADSRPQTAAEDIFDLDLHGDELARYEEMRRKVEYEISIGIRNANGYINR